MKNLSCKYSLFFAYAFILLILQSCKKTESLPSPATDSTESTISNNLSVLSATPPDSLFDKILTPRTSANPRPITSGYKICSDSKGNLYVSGIPYIRKITPQGVVSQFGPALNANGIKAAKNGDIYIVGLNNNTRGLAKISPGGVVSYITLTGQQLQDPTDLALADDGTIYVTDEKLHQVLKITPDRVCTPLAGSQTAVGSADGVGSKAHFTNPYNIKLAADGVLWVVDGNEVDPAGRTIRKVTLSGAVSTKFRLPNNFLNDYIFDIAVAKRDRNFNPSPYESIFILYRSGKVSHWGTNGVETPLNIYANEGNATGVYTKVKYGETTAICIHENAIYIPESYNYYNFVVRKITKTK
ncbi:hypothetical protein SNE25_12330 [Mucilaginibacter sabulilitoris]|uniref:NHL repeat-containing protein n=1 Tax=Mucilaginibacter sabulilitoris TaxID=1173583 RepID=A0ABZ0TXY8_9SPHI|nr:hypothetical protein [Mucilaginibacter sabulilitoris]WPU96305.1 hypothetical protein SNE25_12330 [Mucilaginibacter sabulilitoris]